MPASEAVWDLGIDSVFFWGSVMFDQIRLLR